MPKKKTKEEFIQEATEKHEGKYDYSKVEYVNSRTKVCIICSEHGHGEFWQRPNDHLSGNGCPKCGKEANRLSKEDFIKKAKKIHGDKYDYSKVEYVNCMTKVCIICPEHGEFYQQANVHTQGYGCPKCGSCYVPTNEEWIASANKVHKDKYDYSKVEYLGTHTKVCIICPEHGEFWQRPHDHIKGCGCSKCKGDKFRKRYASIKKSLLKRLVKSMATNMIIPRLSMLIVKPRFVSFVLNMVNFGKHLTTTWQEKVAQNVVVHVF